LGKAAKEFNPKPSFESHEAREGALQAVA